MPLLNARDLTDLQWAVLDALIPEPPRRKDGRGRPWKGRRSVLNGILWVLRTGAPWADLPERYPSYQTCHRRFQAWVRSGIMRGVLEALLKIYVFKVGSMSAKPSSMAPLPQPKKGIEGRQNETWQGNEDHSRGRPPWPPGSCIS